MAAVCGLHHAVLCRLQVQYTHTLTGRDEQMPFKFLEPEKTKRQLSSLRMCVLAFGCFPDPAADDTREGSFSKECPQFTIKTDNAAG